MKKILSKEELIKYMENQSVVDYQFFEDAFGNWFERDRCPFHEHMYEDLIFLTRIRFFEWVYVVTEKGKRELTSDELLDKFNEIIVGTALSLVKDDDETISILLPDIPRTGDSVELFDADGSSTHAGVITERRFSESEDKPDVILTVLNEKDGKSMEVRNILNAERMED